MKRKILVALALLLLCACKITTSEYKVLEEENKQLEVELAQLQTEYDHFKTRVDECKAEETAYWKANENRIKNTAGSMFAIDLLDKLNTQKPDLSIIGTTDILGAYIEDMRSEVVYIFFGNGQMLTLSAAAFFKPNGGGAIGEYTYTFDPKASLLIITNKDGRYKGKYTIKFMKDKNIEMTDINNSDWVSICKRLTP